MRRRSFLLATVVGSLALGACGGSELVVEAVLDQQSAEGGTEVTPLSGVEILVIPFDRDAIFDSLGQAFSEPEPPIPDSILVLQEAIAEAQDAWQTAESQWNTVRDSLKVISDRLQRMSRASGEYRVLFNDFNDLEAREGQLDRRRQETFNRFTSLQSQVAQQSEEVRIRRAQWADEAFADVDEVFDARVEELGREIQVDTLGAGGVATFQLPAGEWWVHGRYELPYSELYWNVPVTVEGDSTHVRLSRENAQVRPKL